MPLLGANSPVVPPDMNFDSKLPWAEDSLMIIPFTHSQTLIHEAAAILAMKTFLHIAHLPYTEDERFNASEISPNGKLPVLKCGDYIVSELDGVIQLAQSKGISLSAHLSAAEKADLRAYLSLVHNVLGNAMLYLSWIDQDVYNNITWHRVGSPYNFPLNKIVPWTIRRRVRAQLNALKWGQRKVDEVFREVDTCLYALSERLGESEHFFGSSPTELDALVYGFLFTMITTKLPTSQQLAFLVKRHRNLTDFIQRMESMFTYDNTVKRESQS